MLELWESIDQDASIDLMVGKGQKVDALPTDHKISKRFTEPHQEGNKRRILEILDSEVQKLTNLHIFVEDLKRKVEITEKSKEGKGFSKCPLTARMPLLQVTLQPHARHRKWKLGGHCFIKELWAREAADSQPHQRSIL
ncbi:hypothetical protein ACE6H2_004763 [Prunus campanulata]